MPSLTERVCRYIVEKAQSNLPSEAIVSQFQDGRAYTPKINTNALIARNTSWAFSAIRWNANSVAMPILRLFVAKPASTSKSRFPTRPISKEAREFIETKATIQQRFAGREVEEVLQHPLIEMLQRVNGQMETFELRYLTEQSKEVTGNAFWWKCRNNLGTPEELWFLHPQFMRVVADKKNFISGFKYGRSVNTSEFIPIEDIVFFRNPDVSSPVLGIGELQKAITSIDLSNEMNVHELTLLARGGTPETIMSFPSEQTVSPDEIKRMKQDYKRKYRGTRNAGNLMIATGGAKIDKFGFNQKEMQFLGGRKWSRGEIFACFGVPETFVDMPSVSRANADTANTEYQRRTILPKLIQTEDTLNEQLVIEFDENLFVAFDNPVPEDKEFRLKEKQTNITIGYSTVNEERARDGLDPVDGGDDLHTPGVVPIDEPVKRVKAIIPRLAMPAANFIPEEFTDEVQKYFKAFGTFILTQADAEAFKSVKVADPGDLVSRWFDFSVWDKRAENAMLPFIRASILLAGPKALRSIDASAQFDNSSPGVQEALSARTVSIRGINRTLQKDTRATIAAGLEGGESVSNLRKRIGGVFGFDDRNRALRIARTETIWGLNAGAVEGYKQSGVVVAKEWSTAEDERVCQWCGPMDGKTVGLDGDYWKMGDHMIGVDGGRLNFEVENVGHPPLHPMCRCAIIPVVRG